MRQGKPKNYLGHCTRLHVGDRVRLYRGTRIGTIVSIEADGRGEPHCRIEWEAGVVSSKPESKLWRMESR